MPFLSCTALLFYIHIYPHACCASTCLFILIQMYIKFIHENFYPYACYTHFRLYLNQYYIHIHILNIKFQWYIYLWATTKKEKNEKEAKALLQGSNQFQLWVVCVSIKYHYTRISILLRWCVFFLCVCLVWTEKKSFSSFHTKIC